MNARRLSEGVKERPILFSGPMVRAILDGRKTQTRRTVKPQPVYGDVAGVFASWQFQTKHGNKLLWPNARERILALCPKCAAGERLWVRETFHAESRDTIHYRADGFSYEDDPNNSGWKPSIFMPRWASRITLEISEVRVQRLQDISEDDAMAEGIDLADTHWAGEEHLNSAAFARLWDGINAKRATWESNPWVWVISFARQLPA